MTFRKFLLAVLVSLVIGAVAHAEIVVLRDGRLLQVEILAGDERGIEVRLLETDGRLFVRWELLREDDRKKLRVRFGLEVDDSDADLVMEGHRVFVRRGDYYDGLVEAETQDEVVLRRPGRTMTFRREGIRRVEEREVSVFDVYTSEELYARRLEEIAPAEDDGPGHFEMARWATKVGRYEEAIGHFLRVRESDPEFRADYVGNQLERLEVLAKNKTVLDAMAEAEREGRRNRFDVCFGILDTLLQAPELDASLRAEIEKKKETFQKRRWEYFRDLISREYHREFQKRVDAVARSRDIKSDDEEKRMTIDRAMAWARGKLHKEILDHLAEKHGLDPKKETAQLWEERKKTVKRSASYGSGTFVVEGERGGGGREQRNRGLQDQLRQLQDALQQRGGRRGQEAQQAAPPPPKLISKDEWWESVESATRSQFLRAYFAENAKVFEVVSDTQRACVTCGGEGSLKRLGPQGGFYKVTCPRCQGTRGDKIVTYR